MSFPPRIYCVQNDIYFKRELSLAQSANAYTFHDDSDNSEQIIFVVIRIIYAIKNAKGTTLFLILSSI